MLTKTVSTRERAAIARAHKVTYRATGGKSGGTAILECHQYSRIGQAYTVDVQYAVQIRAKLPDGVHLAYHATSLDGNSIALHRAIWYSVQADRPVVLVLDELAPSTYLLILRVTKSDGDEDGSGTVVVPLVVGIIRQSDLGQSAYVGTDPVPDLPFDLVNAHRGDVLRGLVKPSEATLTEIAAALPEADTKS